MDSFNSYTDEEIIGLYKNGENPEAFKFLIDKYTPILYNFVARLAGRQNASDLLQEVFIKIWKNLQRFDTTKASFKTWVFTIAKNTATDFLRKKKSVVFSDIEKYDDEENSFSDNIPDENLLPDKILEKIQDKALLDETIEKLRPEYKDILLLHYQENMTFDEIGKILNKPPNTVKSQHRRAILELRTLIE